MLRAMVTFTQRTDFARTAAMAADSSGSRSVRGEDA
jgi:hypothetical protein